MVKKFFSGKSLAEIKQVEDAKLAHEQAIQRIKELARANEYTSDIAALERRKRHLLLIPDEMMARHPEHHRLGANALKVCDAFTQDNFSLWRKSMGWQAQLIPLQMPLWSIRQATVKGELYLLPTPKLFELDRHRENGVQYDRKRIKVVIPYREVLLRKAETIPNKDVKVSEELDFNKKSTCYAEIVEPKLLDPVNVWMYVGIPDFWGPLLDGGYSYKLSSRFKPNNPLLKNYYFHTVEDYDKRT